ncbi:MAG: hypothetical protein V1824_03360, partial [archaeon]
MDNNYYLTKSEQSLLDPIKETTNIFTNQDIQEIFPKLSSQTINKLILRLKNKNQIISLERGKYIFNQALRKIEMYKIAQEIYSGYLAFSSALELYGLIDYEVFTIFIATNHKSKTISFNNN